MRNIDRPVWNELNAVGKVVPQKKKVEATSSGLLLLGMEEKQVGYRCTSWKWTPRETGGKRNKTKRNPDIR
jgi:hypothetical protein